MTQVKVCCIATVAEAELAARLGANAIGLVSAMPSGPGVIAERDIAEIAAAAPPQLERFLLTSLVEADAIAAQARRCGVSTLQLCDLPEPAGHARVRALLPGVRLVQVVHVIGSEALAEAHALARHADALLLDSGDPRLAVKRLGGTGTVHDWRVSAEIARSVGVPVWLAGGLTPANVGEAVRTVRPHGVDVCTGVRRDGRLDPRLLEAFMAAVGPEDMPPESPAPPRGRGQLG